MTNAVTEVLDPKQLRLIEATHRGFLYQHLFAVGCLLKALSSNVSSVLVERDEDIELIRDQDHLYAQVKTRSRHLASSDVAGALLRFSAIRQAHASDSRPGSPSLYIISNVEPNHALVEEMHSWPNDVTLLTPNSSTIGPNCLPPAWVSVEEALKWCIAQANQIPFRAISAETLVWKLAAIVQHASAGLGLRQEHEFRSVELATLFEQIVTEFHRLPEPPVPYRIQEQEPDLVTDNRIRLLLGLSGAGKTAWASQASLHEGAHIAYFDAGDMPQASLSPSLARELAARLSSLCTFELQKVFLPGSTGIQSLRILDSVIRTSSLDLVIVFDNVHLSDPADLISAVKAIPSAKWVLIGQPWPGKSTIEARLDLQSEELKGWGIETISTVLADRHCSAEPMLSERIRQLTGGLPLFVQDAARLTEAYYRGDTEKFCIAMESLTNAEVTGQQSILSEVYTRLSSSSAAAASLLVIADVPISVDEAVSVVELGLGIAKDQAYGFIRELTSWGVVQVLRDQRMALHDSFRTIAREGQQSLAAQQLTAAKKQLVELLKADFSPARTARLRLLSRLLPEIGQTKALIDLSSSLSEYFHEYGFAEEFRAILADVVKSESLSPEERFWAADTLVFWSLQAHDLNGIDSWLDVMESCLPLIDDNSTEQFALLMKKMLLAAARGRPSRVEQYYLQAKSTSGITPQKLRILNYNYANCLFQLEDYEAAEARLFKLIEEYYGVLGIEVNDVLFKKAIEVVPKLSAESSIDDAKHLADALDLTAQVLNAQGKASHLCRIHSCKFYAIADAISSAVRVGQDFVDESLSRNDIVSAREMFETMLLPLIRERKMLGRWVDVHSQYAVVLAYDGEVRQAQTLMNSLEPMIGDDKRLQEQFARQSQIIQNIGISRTVFRSAEEREAEQFLDATPSPEGRRKIGRNERCPCGSGLKYKKCCGK